MKRRHDFCVGLLKVAGRTDEDDSVHRISSHFTDGFVGEIGERALAYSSRDSDCHDGGDIDWAECGTGDGVRAERFGCDGSIEAADQGKVGAAVPEAGAATACAGEGEAAGDGVSGWSGDGDEGDGREPGAGEVGSGNGEGLEV